MKLIGCNRRTAVEYVEVLQHFRGIPEYVGLEVSRMQLEEEGKSPHDIYSGPSSLAQHYPAGEEGKDNNNKSPRPLPTWYYRYVREK